MSNLPELTSPVYATDEDILVNASGDFMTLAPAWQCMAQGTDGVFRKRDALGLYSSARSTSGRNGVAPNQVVVSVGPKAPVIPAAAICWRSIRSVRNTPLRCAGRTRI